MSFSREIALAVNDPEKLNQIFTIIAKEVLSKGGNRDRFDAVLRPQLHALHAAGWSKESLSDLRKKSRGAFYTESKNTLGGLPIEKYAQPTRATEKHD